MKPTKEALKQFVQILELFDELQLGEITLGIKSEVPVSVYADTKFNADQMKQIRLGLVNKVDVSFYAKPEFSWEQMRKIRLRGHKQNTKQ